MAFVISSKVHLLWSWLPDEGSVKSRIEIDGAMLFVSPGRVVPSVFIMSSMGGMFYRQTIQQDAFIYGNRQARGKLSRVTLFFLSKFIINEHMFEHMVFPLPGGCSGTLALVHKMWWHSEVIIIVNSAAWCERHLILYSFCSERRDGGILNLWRTSKDFGFCRRYMFGISVNFLPLHFANASLTSLKTTRFWLFNKEICLHKITWVTFLYFGWLWLTLREWTGNLRQTWKKRVKKCK